MSTISQLKTNIFSSNIFTLTSHGQRRVEDYSPWGCKNQTGQGLPQKVGVEILIVLFWTVFYL